MRKIEINQLTDNMIEAIGHEWMLITAGTAERFNTMTASWGGIGYLWNRPVVFVFIRPERYTYEFTEAGETFTLSFLGSEYKDVHKITGSKSGRDTDKIAATGLVPLTTEGGNILFEQTRLGLECRKLYSDMLRPEGFADPAVAERWYGAVAGGFHRMYVAEIVNVWVRE